MRARRDERRAKSVRLAVVLSLFAVLLATALLVGRAVIDPVLRPAANTRDAKRVGDIVYWMPDGSFCRRLSFDNETASLTEGRGRTMFGQSAQGARAFRQELLLGRALRARPGAFFAVNL